MKDINHLYQDYDRKKCDCCGEIKIIDKGVKEYNISKGDLDTIADIIRNKYRIKLEVTETNLSTNEVISKNSKVTWKDSIPISEIDDAVKRVCPDIEDIPEGIETYKGLHTPNVWLDASLAVQEELEKEGAEIVY